jgi:hypothetical protein
MDSAVADLARRRVAVRLSERQEQLDRELARVAAKLAHQGMHESSSHAQVVADLCAQEADIRAQLVWREFATVLMTAGSTSTDDLAHDLKGEVAAHLPPNRPHLSMPVARWEQMLPGITDRFQGLVRRAIDKAAGDIDLFVLSLRRREVPAAAVAPTVVVQGSVQSLQTGAKATTTIVQHFDASERVVLLRALDALQEALAKVDRLDADARATEVLDLVADCRTEAEKATPNKPMKCPRFRGHQAPFEGRGVRDAKESSPVPA